MITAPIVLKVRCLRLLMPDAGHGPGATIDWTVRAGQHWALLGPNGAGKSQLARAVCGLQASGAAQLLYGVEPDGTLHPWFRRGQVVCVDPLADVQVIPSPYHQARWNSADQDGGMTVAEALSGESIEFVSRYQSGPTRVPAAEYARRRDRAVALLGLTALRDRRTVQLSNGEGRKLLLARALMQAPRLLLLDDPMAGLDAGSRASLTAALTALARQPRPQLVVITARPAELPPGLSHALCLSRGRVVARGPLPRALARTRSWSVPTDPAAGTAHAAAGADSGPAGAALAEPPLLELRGVGLRYRDARPLAGVDWTVNRGERWALMGANGAGKSALLSLILGDNPQAYRCEVRLFGFRRRQGDDIWQVKARIGWTAPELQRHYPAHIPCVEVVCSGYFDTLGLHRAPSPAQRQAAVELLRRLRVGHLEDIPFAGAGAGEQRLVLLARALAKRPELLVLDEPCQGLDAGRASLVRQLVERWYAGAHSSLVWVTHDPDELPGSMSHLLALDDGRVRYCGPWVRPA